MLTRQNSMQWRTGVRHLLLLSLLSVLILLVVLCGATLWTSAAAPPPPADFLDPTFNGNGIVTTNINNFAFGNDLAIQPDGKIVVASMARLFVPNGFTSSFAVARYNGDGSLDATFGGGGIVTPVLGFTQAKAVALQPDGKIVVGLGSTDSYSAVVMRYNTDGSLDTTFGSNGIVRTIEGYYAEANDLAIQPDGKIVVVGRSLDFLTGSSFLVARYNADGSLDTAFNGDGVVVMHYAGNPAETTEVANAVALQADGKIVVMGDGLKQLNRDFTFVRFNADGTLDLTFDGDGVAQVEFGGQDVARALAIQADGKIVAVGSTAYLSIAVARLNTNGTLDTTFDSDGLITPGILGGCEAGAAVTLQANGKIVVVANGMDPACSIYNDHIEIMRYNADGSVDTGFGNAGALTTPIGSGSRAGAVAVQSDGKIVVTGMGNYRYIFPFSDYAELAVVRYSATNNPPVVTITGPASGSIYAVNTPVNFTGTFTDDVGDTHTAHWTINSVSQPAIVVEPPASTPGSADTTYTFNEAGVYKVTLTVTDNGNLSGTVDTVNGLEAMVVIYDPDAGFITGGGWINSPPGAFVPMPTLTGKTSFGFVSKYQNGATVPIGNTEFQFKAGGLNFSSTSDEWLVISAGKKVQYKGFGTINGAGNYHFMLTAIDGDRAGGDGQDKFRMRIWSDDYGLIYDNQLNAPDSDDPTTVLAGGSIVIH